MKRLLKQLKILMVEDVLTDAELIERELNQSKVWYTAKRVDTREGFEEALEKFNPDLILADYDLPSFDGITALRLAHNRLPDVPFIFVSGSIGEDRAVEALRHGATDYIIKDRMQRLGAAVLRAMEEVTLRMERRRADAALLLSEERFRTVASATTDGIWDWDLKTDAVWLSEGVRKLFGYSDVPEFMTLGWVCDRVHPEELAALRSRIDQYLREGVPSWEERYRFRRGDGRYAFVLDRARILFDKDRRPLRVVAALSDITAAVRTEQLQRMQFDMTRLLADAQDVDTTIPALLQVWCRGLDGLVGAIWFVDKTTNRLQFRAAWSDRDSVAKEIEAASRLERFAPGEGLPGRVWEAGEAIGIADLSSSPQFVRRAAIERANLESAFAFPITSGRETVGVIECFCGEPLTIDDQLHEIAKDIGSRIGQFLQRKQFEHRIQQLSRQNQLILESAADGIFGVDPGGYATFVNPAAAKMLGWSTDELIGKNLHEVAHHSRPDGSAYPWQECPTLISISRGTTQTSEEVLWRRDGSSIPVEYTTTPIMDEEGNRLGAVVVFRDVEERKLLERQLEQATRLSSLGRLAATIAHEFNNVLMGIQPFNELIRKHGVNDPKIQKATEQIGRSIQRGKGVSQEILRYTRPAQPNIQRIELEEWLEDFGSEMRGVIGERIDLIIHVPDKKVILKGDPLQLLQVFSNLVLNARDAMPGGGTITIVAEPSSTRSVFPFGVVPNPEQYLHFTVKDSGPGMSEEILSKIFEPLFTTKKTGTGLGLAVTHQIVQQHGGYIFAESELDKGTTFHVFLPASATTDRTSASPATSSHSTRPRPLTLR